MNDSLDQLRAITYDVEAGGPPPEEGQFLVSLGAKGLGSVYHIANVRRVKQKGQKGRVDRYALAVYVADDMKPFTQVDGDRATVKGEPALMLYWHPRGKPQVRRTIGLSPLGLSYQQVLGPLMDQTRARGAVLLLLSGHQLLPFAQWGTAEEPLQMLLGFIQRGDPVQFEQAWESEPNGRCHDEPGPVVVPFGGCLREYIREVVTRLACEGAVLYFYDADWKFFRWGAWRDEVAENWVKMLLAEDTNAGVHALWAGHQVQRAGLSPTTYVEVVAGIRREQDRIVDETAQKEGWDEATKQRFKYCSSIN